MRWWTIIQITVNASDFTKVYANITKDRLQYLVTPTSKITDAMTLEFLCVTNKINYFFKKQVKYNQEHPRCKKGQPRTKTGLA